MKEYMEGRFRIIPVLDLKDGVVVHGVRGAREKYRPVHSVLTPSAEFFVVLESFVRKLDVKEFYVADLDAIMSGGEKDQLDIILRAKKSGCASFSLMVDAGAAHRAEAEKIFQAGADQVVVGTETLPSLEELEGMVEAFGPRRLAVSIDTKDRKIISPSREISRMTPAQAVKEISRTGIQELILLELGRVGTGSGIHKSLVRECLAALQEDAAAGTLLIGGGVSGYEDLKWLAENGIAGALVASVLHSGLVDGEMIRSLEKMK